MLSVRVARRVSSWVASLWLSSFVLLGCSQSRAPACGSGQSQCSDGSCHDLRADADNCGVCGNACGADQVCSAGRCALSCPTGTVACGRSCVDPQGDVANCGSCGVTCSAANGTPSCTNGQCSAAACSSGYFDYHGTCMPCSGSCPTGQFQSSACDATNDRDCSACTPIANCGAESCTTATDQTCRICNANYYLDGGSCHACSGACPAGQQLLAACSATADRTCTSCTPIANCASETCSDPSNPVCSACASGYYLAGNACVACSGACPSGQFQATACSATADRTCQACSGACPAGQFQSAACSATADRSCASCSPISNCTTESCTTATDQTCTSCAANFYSSGGGCSACSPACASGEYQVAACGGSSDRSCAACTPINGCAAVSCTSASDSTCNACGSGFYFDGSACQTCSSCPAGGSVATACGGNSDTVCTFATDCYALLLSAPGTPSGVYTIDPDGSGGVDPFAAYCDMTSNGGGWTLLLKVDGYSSTFQYSSPYWTNADTYQPGNTALDLNAAKLAGFANQPFNAMRVGMFGAGDGQTHYLELAQSSSSLLSLFSGGPVLTALGRQPWLNLMSDSALQPSCNREGFNIVQTSPGADPTEVRIGIIGDTQSDCSTAASRLGIGGSGVGCGGPDLSSGYLATCMPGGSSSYDYSFGYVFVRNCPGGVCQCGALASCGALCADTNSDVDNCGGCGQACSFANASRYTCSSGNCGISACSAGYGNCNGDVSDGCETSLMGDVDNCGACGYSCEANNGPPVSGNTWTCSAGSCAQVACPPNSGDCDGNPDNGCETDLSSDGQNCGACGDDCGGGANYCCNSACVAGGQTVGPQTLYMTDFSQAICASPPPEDWVGVEGSVVVTSPTSCSGPYSLTITTSGGPANTQYIAADTCNDFIGTYTTDAGGAASVTLPFYANPGEFHGFDVQETTDGTPNGLVPYTSQQTNYFQLP